jgi:hypothetical protein
MNTYVVPYRILAGERYMLPLCEIDLLGRNGRIPLLALVDSGAAVSVFPKKAAEDAGLALPSAPNDQVLFGGSASPAWRTEVTLELATWRWRTEVTFVERLVFRYVLLGRHGVFARFNEVAFVEKAKEPRVEFRA